MRNETASDEQTTSCIANIESKQAHAAILIVVMVTRFVTLGGRHHQSIKPISGISNNCHGELKAEEKKHQLFCICNN